MTPKPNDKMLSYAQSLDKADAPPEDMALGSYFAQKVTLTCQALSSAKIAHAE